MASVLKVTANGTTTSPVVRGAWVLDRMLGTPPPTPPPTWRRWSRTSAAQRRSASNLPSTNDRVVQHVPQADRSAWLCAGELRRDWRLAGELSNHRQRKARGRRRPAHAIPHGQAGRSVRCNAEWRQVQGYRRIQTVVAQRQGPVGTSINGAAGHLCYGCSAADERQDGEKSKRSWRRFARKTTGCERWCMRLCGASCFRRNDPRM